MPIKGLSDAFTKPLLGRIGLGEVTEESASSRAHPENKPYFVINETEAYDNDQVIHTNDWLKKLKDIYGEKPTFLEGWFTCNDPNLFAPQYLKAYASNKLVCQGDGERACWYRDAVKLAQISRTTADLSEVDLDPSKDVPTFPPYYDFKANSSYRTCKFRNCKHFCAPGTKGRICRPIMELLIEIPRVSTFGVFKITTSSEATIKNLNNLVNEIQAQAERQGYTEGVTRVPLKIYKKRIHTQYKKEGTYIVDIQLHPEFIAQHQEEIENQRQSQMIYYGDTLKALPTVAETLDEAPVELVTPEFEIKEAKIETTLDGMLQNDQVLALFVELEAVTGKKFMPAKRKEAATKCSSIEELMGKLSEAIEKGKTKTETETKTKTK